MFRVNMDHTRTIKLHQAALRKVVEEIFALLELVLDGTTKRLPPILYHAAIRLLCPAEAALRRLIVVAAMGLTAKPLLLRSMPKGKKIVAKGTGPLSFQLFDTRKNFNRAPPSTSANTIQPRIHFFAAQPVIVQPSLQAKKPKTSARLIRRFAAFKLALENIPRQARRLAQWQAKRAKLLEAKFRFPLRPGPPPGLHRKSDLEIDRILRECHSLTLFPAAPS